MNKDKYIKELERELSRITGFDRLDGKSILNCPTVKELMEQVQQLEAEINKLRETKKKLATIEKGVLNRMDEKSEPMKGKLTGCGKAWREYENNYETEREVTCGKNGVYCSECSKNREAVRSAVEWLIIDAKKKSFKPLHKPLSIEIYKLRNILSEAFEDVMQG